MDDLFPMLLSAVLGTLVGLQRQMAHKPAGLRTHTRVCIGSAMFLLVAPHAMRSFGMASFDPTRIVHGVVAGGTLLALLVLIGYRKAEKALSLAGDG